jgi:hypothetical protein
MLMMASSAAAGTGAKRMRARAAIRRTMKRDIICLIRILLLAERVGIPTRPSSAFLR